jgi:hypothetical protein
MTSAVASLDRPLCHAPDMLGAEADLRLNFLNFRAREGLK